jgi:hypothetical protein
MLIRHVVNYSVVFCLTTLSGIAFGETLTDYFPLEDGNLWTYRAVGPGYILNTTQTVTGDSVFNGRNTKELRSSAGPDGAEYAYYTNDEEGIRLHGFFIPTLGRITLEPPAVIAGKTMDVNETVESRGRASFSIFGIGEASLDYESSSTFQGGYENLSVPAGDYETIVLKTSLRIYGKIAGEEFDENTSGVDWYAKYTGIVQSQLEGEQGKSVLVTTNVRKADSLAPILDLLLE